MFRAFKHVIVYSCNCENVQFEIASRSHLSTSGKPLGMNKGDGPPTLTPQEDFQIEVSAKNLWLVHLGNC